MAKDVRIKIKMKSTGEGSSYYYTTMKSVRNTTGKLRMKRYDPHTRQHEIFEEGKIK